MEVYVAARRTQCPSTRRTAAGQAVSRCSRSDRVARRKSLSQRKRTGTAKSRGCPQASAALSEGTRGDLSGAEKTVGEGESREEVDVGFRRSRTYPRRNAIDLVAEPSALQLIA